MEPIIFMFCLTLHNIEEALWLVKWNQINMPNSKRSLNKFHFIFSVIGITILGYLISGLYALYPNNIFLEYSFIGCVGSMLVNAIAPHLILTLRYKKYCPGVFTGCLLLIPFNSIILYNAAITHLKISEILLSTLIVGLVLLAAIPLLEKMAKSFLKGID